MQDAKPKRDRKGGKAAAPTAEADAPLSDAARIEVLSAQLEAASAKLEETDKRCSYLLLERVKLMCIAAACPTQTRRPAAADHPGVDSRCTL